MRRVYSVASKSGGAPPQSKTQAKLLRSQWRPRFWSAAVFCRFFERTSLSIASLSSLRNDILVDLRSTTIRVASARSSWRANDRKTRPMKTKLLLVMLFSFAFHPSAIDAQNASPPATPARSVKQYTIEQFMDTTRLGGNSFSTDEKAILFHSNKSGIFNVYTVPVTGGGAKQLTTSTKESTFAVSYFPWDTRFLFRHDKGGDENEHLYLRELGGSDRDLTPGDKTKARFLGWSHDRKSFFYSTNARDARYFDIFEMNIGLLKPGLIYQDETGYDFGAISNDKKFIAFGKSGGSTADSDVYLYNTRTREMKHITPHEGDVANSPEAFDPKSNYLYFLSNEGNEFMYIARYDLKEGKREVVEIGRAHV